MTLKKTASELYTLINKEAIRLMLEEGYSREEAFERAVPKHFETTAIEEDKIPNIFTEMVWKALNTIQDELKLEKVNSGRIMIKMQLQGNADRQRVYSALRKLVKLGLVYCPNGKGSKSWARVRKPKLESDFAKRLAEHSAAAD
jgi:Glu-tRNA(Gln) amidotransferase subunit E-like FAD-binding protein